MYRGKMSKRVCSRYGCQRRSTGKLCNKHRYEGTECYMQSCSRQWFNGKGLCQKHYKQQLYAGTVCAAHGCEREQRTSGLCRKHYDESRMAKRICHESHCDQLVFDSARYCRLHSFEGTICQVDGCTAQWINGLGFCISHTQLQRGSMDVCQAKGCFNKQTSATLCGYHYQTFAQKAGTRVSGFLSVDDATRLAYRGAVVVVDSSVRGLVRGERATRLTRAEDPLNVS